MAGEYCSHCKTTEGRFVKVARKGTRQYHLCRACNTRRRKEYYDTNGKEKIATINTTFQKRNPEKLAAWQAVARALRNKVITKPDKCSVCNAEKANRLLHAHHEDYTKPLDILWVCAGCHRDEHKKCVTI
jgi:hypothetical protein